MGVSGHRIDGVAVAKARYDAGFKTQAAFAREIGIHSVTMSLIENGKTNVSLELVERIAKATRKRREDFMLPDADDDQEAAQPVTAADLIEALRPLALLVEQFEEAHEEAMRA